MIRAVRAREISGALERAHDLGYGLAFCTLTLRHKRSDDLRFTLDLVQEAWRRMTMWRASRDLMDRIGLVGSIRATEITYGRNGWHPHAHVVMVLKKPLSDAERRFAESALAALWIRAVEKLGGRLPTRKHGVKLLTADESGRRIGEYLAKLQEAGETREKIALELARGDLKRGRRLESFHPFELLDHPSGRDLWLEYVAATKGRRAFGWSRGLRDLLMPDVDELDDDQILARVETGELLGLIDGQDWDRVYRDSPEQLHAALLEAESTPDPVITGVTF